MAAPGSSGELTTSGSPADGETASAMPTSGSPAGVPRILGISALTMRSGGTGRCATPHGPRAALFSDVVAFHRNHSATATGALWRTYAAAQG